MTVFVAGVHGVGKSYLCEKYAQTHDVLHESASGLIRKEKDQLNWSADKKVANVDDNQVALASAVHRISEQGHLLLLDGHFVLIDPYSEFIRLPPSVFKDLVITGVVLIEVSPKIISSRLKSRDSTQSAVDIVKFIEAEREQARLVCKEIGAALHILHAPNEESFTETVSSLFNAAQ
ncbi:ATP-binding protein [Pseudomonas sp. UBA6310]|uniref:ATP-binding protein n=1 Tax=Pseudomonas sp. UBA6310 TaxID=1947327 RepID=UPI00257FDC89|nr:ATP-binding protein [Pseudomonas sp. UBA6310]